MYKWLVSAVTLLYITMPQMTQAAGLVPCGGEGEPQCQWLHVPILINDVIDWVVGILTLAVVIILVYAGIRLVVSGGDPSARETAKRYISNVLIGLVIVLAGWILINTVIKVLVSPTGELPNGFGPWNEIPPVTMLSPQSRGNTVNWAEYETAQESARPTASGLSGSELSPAELAAQVAAISGDPEQAETLLAAAEAGGLEDESTKKVFQALIAQESSNCANKVGPETRYGTAYGCGQMLVSTARDLDPSLEGKPDSEVAARLRDDNEYNMVMSAQYFNGLLQKYDGDTTKALAAYNGGTKANLSSNNCSGKLRWQCEWDGDDCMNGSGSDCSRNTGYEETRNYVSNILGVANSL